MVILYFTNIKCGKFILGTFYNNMYFFTWKNNGIIIGNNAWYGGSLFY